MNEGVIPISDYQLALSIILVLIAGSVSAALKLGLLKSLLLGTFRTFVQLTLIGYVLTYVFDLNNFWLILILVFLMCFIASRTAVSRRLPAAGRIFLPPAFTISDTLHPRLQQSRRDNQ